MARPTKLTPELIEAITRNLKISCWIETACAAAGIHKDTYYDWLKVATKARDKPKSKRTKREQLCIEFSDACTRANAETEMMHAGILLKAGQAGDWRASRKVLESRFGDRWGHRAGLEVSGSGGGPVQVSMVAQEIDYGDLLGDDEDA